MSFFDDLEKKAQERKDYLSFEKQIDLINKNIATPSIINTNANLTQEQVAIKDKALADKQRRANSELMAAPVGMVEGMVGFGGDIERLGRGAVGAVTASNGNRWDTFLNELGNKDTTLWNTENVQDWTNRQLEGTDFGNRLLEGKGGRLLGEILAPAPPIAGAMKYGGKALDFLDEGATFANKYLNKLDIQPGLSIKSVDNAYRPGYVYKTVNTVDGTKYIGSKLAPQGHSGKFFNENYYGSGSDLKKAIDKYGKDKFINVKEIDTRTVKGLKDAEQGLLNKVGARQDPTYYNRHNHYSGGGGATDATKKKMSDSMKGKNTGKRGPQSEYHKKKISNSMKGKEKTKEHIENVRESLTGYQHTDKTKANMSKGHSTKKGKRSNNFGKRGQIPWNKGMTKAEEAIYKALTKEERILFKQNKGLI